MVLNPYMRALAIITRIVAGVAVILLIVGGLQSNGGRYGASPC